jgi:hypothetical protein
MNLCRRAAAGTAAAAMAALVTSAASACGSATTTTGASTNGLENKSPADVLEAATAALKGAKSVHVVSTGASGNVDLRIQHGSSTGTFTQAGAKFEFTIIGSKAYLKTGRAGLVWMGVRPADQRQDAGRWLKVPASDLTGFTVASLASQLTTDNGPLEPKVRQATVEGRKVVVISWRNGATMDVANTGPAYPLRADLKGQISDRFDFTDYGAHVRITAPSNAISLS